MNVIIDPSRAAHNAVPWLLFLGVFWLGHVTLNPGITVFGFVLFAVALQTPLNARWMSEYIIALMYMAYIVIQPLLIRDMSLFLGVKYAVGILATFVPLFIIYGKSWQPEDFETVWHRAIKFFTVVAVINFTTSYMFGFGEVHLVAGGRRVFGFFGDSFSPFLIFPVLYFYFQREYIWSAASLACMFFTGGKAAALMLVFAVMLHVFLTARLKLRVMLIAAFVMVAAAVGVSTLRSVAGDDLVASSLNTRLLSYERGLELFESSPVVGVGARLSLADPLDVKALADVAGISDYFWDGDIDNPIICTMAEMGLIGLAMLLALCVTLVMRAFASMNAVRDAPPSMARSLAISCGLWTVSFIIVYQGTAWFRAGTDQLDFLLTMAPLGWVAAKSITGMSAIGEYSRQVQLSGDRDVTAGT